MFLSSAAVSRCSLEAESESAVELPEYYIYICIEVYVEFFFASEGEGGGGGRSFRFFLGDTDIACRTGGWLCSGRDHSEEIAEDRACHGECLCMFFEGGMSSREWKFSAALWSIVRDS